MAVCLRWVRASAALVKLSVWKCPNSDCIASSLWLKAASRSTGWPASNVSFFQVIQQKFLCTIPLWLPSHPLIRAWSPPVIADKIGSGLVLGAISVPFENFSGSIVDGVFVGWRSLEPLADLPGLNWQTDQSSPITPSIPAATSLAWIFPACTHNPRRFRSAITFSNSVPVRGRSSSHLSTLGE